jgi:hypothetical protein
MPEEKPGPVPGRNVPRCGADRRLSVDGIDAIQFVDDRVRAVP